ncbi:hypothetical protein EYF80_022252 [Liparis tanakae]|uniref:Uncharacterized protein n=1 Tax=Liparis tanakae TaxID=230148 RepID=A0A4Z2HP08_9TELE|nr:hypothetical protein EYF80_022252 [Liparis tanakae]
MPSPRELWVTTTWTLPPETLASSRASQGSWDGVMAEPRGQHSIAFRTICSSSSLRGICPEPERKTKQLAAGEAQRLQGFVRQLAALIAADQQGAHHDVPHEAAVHGARQDVLGDAGGLGADQLEARRDFDGLCRYGYQAEVLAGLTEP